MSGWGNFFGKIGDQFAGRIERLKNERSKLQSELDVLHNNRCTDESAKRESFIVKRIKEIESILTNKASD